jgi:hypothetical protein
MNPQLSPDQSVEVYTRPQNFAILKDFLESDSSSPSQKAIELTTPINNTPDGRVYGPTSELWAALIPIVVQILENHSWHDRLILLLHEMTKIPRPVRSDLGPVEGHSGRFWDLLPAFTFEILERCGKRLGSGHQI